MLKREPLNEQEVLSVVVGGFKKLGIDELLKVQTRFPDVLAKVSGKEVYFELEVDSLGFLNHLDDLRRNSKSKNIRQARLKDTGDDRIIAILCWVNGDRRGELRKSVPHLRIFELQSLLRKRGKINWR